MKNKQITFGMNYVWFSILVLLQLSCSNSQNYDASLEINLDTVGKPMSTDMYGIFFEDINHASDGGLYAELLQNRDFEANNPPENLKFSNDSTLTNNLGWKEKSIKPKDVMGWMLERTKNTIAVITLEKTNPVSKANPNYLKVQVLKKDSENVEISNAGFWGIPCKQDAKYNLSFYAKRDLNSNGKIHVSIQNQYGEILAFDTIKIESTTWKKYNTTLVGGSFDPNSKFVISPDTVGTLYFDMVSLFPKDTWKNKPNGLRADLAQMLADLQPSFFRFPGGCVVEGASLANRIQWKNTIGDVTERPGRWNIWGYHATEGIGFHEFLQLCEDLKTAPMYVVNVGMSCQYRVCEVAPKTQIKEYIQETMDALEYALGSATSKWGAIRAKNGHATPFKIKYVEIGNENWGEDYHFAYKEFYKVIKAKYPEIITIANGIIPLSEQDKKDKVGIETVDEHYYETPGFFYKSYTKYDAYNRKSPWNIYVGEFAVTKGKVGQGNLRAALAESVFMMGMEQNSDVVKMVSYAPTFVNDNDRRWNPDMIVYDNYRAYGTPSYHAFKMFSQNRPAQILPVHLMQKAKAGIIPVMKGKFALSTWNTSAEYKDIKIIKNGGEIFNSELSNKLGGWKFQRGDWVIKAGSLISKNTANHSIATIGDSSWRDYSVTLKARKISGAEGFIIYMNYGGDAFLEWNIGGWGNTLNAAIHHTGDADEDVCSRLRANIEAGKWYDIKIEVKENSMLCYLNGSLIQKGKLKEVVEPQIYANVGINQKELIVKLVNSSNKVKSININIKGSKELTGFGTAIILNSESLDDENSFDNPGKIEGRTIKLKKVGKTFVYESPENSLSILKLQIK